MVRELEEYAEHCRQVAEDSRRRVRRNRGIDWQWALWSTDPQHSITALEERAAKLKQERLTALRNIRKMRKLVTA